MFSKIFLSRWNFFQRKNLLNKQSYFFLKRNLSLHRNHGIFLLGTQILSFKNKNPSTFPFKKKKKKLFKPAFYTKIMGFLIQILSKEKPMKIFSKKFSKTLLFFVKWWAFFCDIGLRCLMLCWAYDFWIRELGPVQLQPTLVRPVHKLCLVCQTLVTCPWQVEML